jgi:hypothetical protein
MAATTIDLQMTSLVIRHPRCFSAQDLAIDQDKVTRIAYRLNHKQQKYILTNGPHSLGEADER